MESYINESMIYVGTGVGAIASYLFVSNSKMREGITDYFLKKMNKTKINKIALERHRIFGLLEQRRSVLSTFVIDDPVKLEFYSTYIQASFGSINDMALELIKLEKDIKDPYEFSSMALSLMYKAEEVTRQKVNNSLNIPKKVERSFNQWRDMMTSAFNESMKSILNDDLFDNNYFTTYRLLDVVSFYVEMLLQTGAVEMARLNGAFEGMTIEDIIKTKNQPSTN